ncbi:hypothetical protein [Streptomyces sp. NPDC048002]|uniref:hypothetical protein n=1 Tax=Streptomyces sp. NPDC048002 TaxID=3154344 RepID=UPI0033CDE8F2
MNYELSRVRLCSVGPTGARFQDVTLDLSGAGRPVTQEQADLFDSVTQTLRPSPASVLFLENGGGKSVLLRLVFSVLLPGRGPVKGAADPRLLDDYVLGQDVSHIVLEWTHAVNGRTLVTGKAMAWKNQTVSKIAENLKEWWYHFRPTDTLALDTLPIADGGRYLSFDAYRKDLIELRDQDPRLELDWPKSHADWTERLGDDLGIDPELFRYQRVMNKGEGEAVRAFDLDSDASFVDFLLKAVVKQDSLTELADLVSQHQDKLARRQSLLLEQEFVEHTVELQGPLIEASRAEAEARKSFKQAEECLVTFAGQLKRRVDDDDVNLGKLEQEVTRLARERDDAAHLAKRWSATVAEQRLSLAAMRLEEAKALVARASTERDDANALTEGWQATAVVLRHQEKTGEAARLRELVNLGEERARPALEARDHAARTLAFGLSALAREADTRARHEEDTARRRDEAEAETRGKREEALKAATEAQGERRSLIERMEAVDADAEQAVADGLAADPETLPQAAQDAQHALEALRNKIDALAEEEDALAEEHIEAQRLLDEAKENEGKARQLAERLQDRMQQAMGPKTVLESEPRLTALLDGEPVDLEDDAHLLLERLAEAVAEGEREHVTLRIEEARDEQARLALADGRLLPPPAVVTEACRILRHEKIDAWPGWEHIADYPQRKREEFLARASHLVSGVMLNSGDDLDRARDVLVALRPQPTAYVAVGTSEALESPQTRHPDGVAFTLPFHPALYDPEAADAEHRAIEERRSQRTRRLAEIKASKHRDEGLRHRIATWRESYPPGALAVLSETAAMAADDLVTAGRHTAERQRGVTGLVERQTQNRTAQRTAAVERDRLTEVSSRLNDIARRLDQMSEWSDLARAAETRRDQQNEAAAQALTAAEEHRRLATEHRNTAGEQLQIKEGAIKERAALPGAQDVPDNADSPREPIAVLRNTYKTASDNYEKADVPDELRRSLTRAGEEETAAGAEYSALDEALRDRAHRLLLTPEASDATTRAQALRRAQRTRKAAEEAVGKAQVTQGQHENALNERDNEFRALTSESVAPMPLERQPRDIAACQEAVEEAESKQSAAAVAKASVDALHAVAVQTWEVAKDTAKEFAILAETLTALTPEEATVEPFTGDAAVARREHRRLNQARNTARDDQARHDRTLRKAIERLKKHAGSDKYDSLNIPVRRQILLLPPEELTAHAPGWDIPLTSRLRSLTDDLNQISRHLKVIIEHLKGEVDKALAILRSAQRLSTLPRSLAEWAGQEFIQFNFDKLGDELLTAHLGQVIEEAAAGVTGDGRKTRRDGLSLLLRGVHTAVPKGFRVYILKPDKVLRTERVRVSKVKEIFSGGQELTAAILLYCTLASLRANTKGRRRDRHAGVLFLDNPIGRANADYLLDLQRSVAEALGVQLVYTTGLFDEKALGQFPLIIRLRNDADLRAARKYLVVDEVIRNHLDRLPPEDGTGRLSAARVFTREARGARA